MSHYWTPLDSLKQHMLNQVCDEAAWLEVANVGREAPWRRAQAERGQSRRLAPAQAGSRRAASRARHGAARERGRVPARAQSRAGGGARAVRREDPVRNAD